VKLAASAAVSESLTALSVRDADVCGEERGDLARPEKPLRLLVNSTAG
jgi:hypothetical protein